MTFRYRRFAAAALGVLVLLVAREAWAGPASDQLRGNIDRVLVVLGDPALQAPDKVDQRRAALRQIANEIFDFNEITKRSLGRYWQARTPAEQEEFVGLLTDLLERSYMSRIESYAGEKVGILGESVDGDVGTVKTKIVTKQGTEIPVDYRVYRQGDRWRAYDVAVEGVSLVNSYRSQFNSIIQRSSYQELVKTLRAKQDERPAVASVARKDRGAGAGGPAGAPGAAPSADGARPRQSP